MPQQTVDRVIRSEPLPPKDRVVKSEPLPSGVVHMTMGGGPAAPAASPPGPQGFWSSAAEASGLSNIPAMVGGLATAVTDPWTNIVDPENKRLEQLRIHGAQGSALEWVPLVGPTLAKAADQMRQGNMRGGLGTVTGTVLPSELAGRVPATARAVKGSSTPTISKVGAPAVRAIVGPPTVEGLEATAVLGGPPNITRAQQRGNYFLNTLEKLQHGAFMAGPLRATLARGKAALDTHVDALIDMFGPRVQQEEAGQVIKNARELQVAQRGYRVVQQATTQGKSVV